MATRYWTGGGTDTNDLKEAANWSDNTLPATGDTAIIADSPTTEAGAFTVSATTTSTLFPASGTFARFSIGPGITRSFGTADGVSATATITITDYTELNNGDKANLIATDGNNYDYTVGDQSSVNSTFEATTSNDVTATNLQTIINSSSGSAGSRFTATVSGAVVTVTQATIGNAGNTAITLTDSGTAGMSKTDFANGLNSHLNIVATTMDLSGRGVYQAFGNTNTTVNVNDTNLSSTAVKHSGTVTNLRVLGGQGTVTVDDSATATNIELIDAPRSNIVVGASVTNSNITLSTGQLETSSNIGTKADVMGGMLTVKGTATCATLDNHVTALTKYNSSGTLTTLNIYGGTVDLTESTASSVTITNATLYEGATIDERNGLNNVVYTNGITMRGGVVLTDIARTLTVSA